MKKIMTPRLMLILSMAVFGTLGLFVRNIPVSSGELALYRAVLAALLIAAYLAVTGQKNPLRPDQKGSAAAARLGRGYGHQLDSAL